MGDLIAERLGRKDATLGFILDGFPRTVEQVSILDGVLGRLGMGLDRVLMLRGSGGRDREAFVGTKRTCPQCGTVFHLESRPPAVAGECATSCGSALVARARTMRKQVIRERLRVYAEQTLPVAAKPTGRRGSWPRSTDLGDVDTVSRPAAIGSRKGSMSPS